MQQLNLYRPEQDVRSHRLSAKNCGLVLLVCFCLLLMAASLLNSQLSEQKLQLKLLEQERTQLHSKFDQLSHTQQQVKVDPSLQQHVDQFAQAVEAAHQRKHWLRTHQKQPIKSTPILAQLMDAQSASTHLSMAHINITDSALSLHGFTSEPVLIGDYLMGISQVNNVELGSQSIQLERYSSGYNFSVSLGFHDLLDNDTTVGKEIQP